MSRVAVRQPPETAPRLMLLLDVEEQFDWDGPFSRDGGRVDHLAELPAFADLALAAGLQPVGVVSYPCVADDEAAALLRQLVRDGRLLPGAHLHPWVTPPFDEPPSHRPSRRLSFPGNLPRALEATKLQQLGECIGRALGERPRVYQAGRYGVGPHTAALLEELGYDVDMSVCPPFDYRAEGGPDFSHEGAGPRWFGERRALLELPVTGAFVGTAGRAAPRLFALAARPALRAARAPGLLARLGLVERLRLSPEGQALSDLQRLTRALLAAGLRTFTFSLHSPSLAIGGTPYSGTRARRDALLDTCARYFDWFTTGLAGRPTTPLALRDELLASAPPPWHAAAHSSARVAGERSDAGLAPAPPLAPAAPSRTARRP